jgi:hypothetical protein
MKVRFVVSLLFSAAWLCCTPAVAQTTWVVDLAGGPGSQFTQIQPAIQAAAPGDFIHVRANSASYAACTVNRPVTIVGGFGAPGSQTGITNITITGIPHGSTCMVARVSTSTLSVTNCPGRVRLEDLSWVVGPVSFVDCADLQLRRCWFLVWYHSIQMTRSRVWALSSRFDPVASGAPTTLILVDSTLRMQSFQAFGAGAGWSTPSNAIHSTNSHMFCGPSTVLRGGQGFIPLGGSYFASSIVFGPGTTITGDPRADIGSWAQTLTLRVDETNLDHARAGQPCSVTVLGPDAGVAFVALSSEPAAPTDLGPYGESWLDQGSLIVLGLYPLDASGRIDFQFTVPATAPIGLRHVAQSLVIGPGGSVKLTMPSPFTVVP